jgi:UDP-2,4-diacetamido-2,4,6-trideoxy-beta-L-altropyranose hydrolase
MGVRAVAIRADASATIGTGHIMRCLTLADALQWHGAQVRFLCRHLPGHFALLLQARGHSLCMLPPSEDEVGIDGLAHAAWLGVSQELDARDCASALADQGWDWLVADHYAIDARWERLARPGSARILVIDDIADRSHDCDLLLDQNLYPDGAQRYRGRVVHSCSLLLGPRYALLRDPFRHWRERVRPRAGSIARVLVFLGGVDADNITGRAVWALGAWAPVGVRVDVVVGQLHGNLPRIRADCANFGFACHVQTDNMAELMALADLAIGAAGSASWERCCVGLPALLVTLADNQIDIARGLEGAGACRYLGPSAVVTVQVLLDALADCARAPEQLRAWSETAYGLADGLGTQRACEAMEALA